MSPAGFAQDCTISLTGRVIDEGTGVPLPYANIYILETGNGAMADDTGRFRIDGLCAGEYHLRISHVGCETEQRFIHLLHDTSIAIALHHHAELLDELVVHGHLGDRTIQVSTTVNRETIAASADRNLSDMLDEIAGVTSLQTGSGIGKPVIHGLYGNRITILNNGIAQSGQQWGNDHAPEIDPYVADHISVIKGTSALAYGGNSLGGVVLVEAGGIPDDPHLHGEANYIFNTNGLGHTLNARLEKNSKWAAWQLFGTVKASGSMRAPGYYLTNTGKREYNAAARVVRRFGEQWKLEAYYSLFRTEIGILRGSHIGNLTDLEAALDRDVPFFTEHGFSYRIQAPSQLVTHHLARLEAAHFITDRQSVRFQYGGQFNERKEFDVRRGGRSDVPALSLGQQSHFTEAVYNGAFGNGTRLKAGAQYRYEYNRNNPETGILPLIPDYTSHEPGLFAIFRQELGRVFWEFGARYDLTALEAITITDSIPREILRIDHRYHDYAVSGGLKVNALEHLQFGIEGGYTLRSPEVNELYSNGLHQGVSGIEEGRNDLNSERSAKVLASVKWSLKSKLFVEALGYVQHIKDYIYLEPQDELRLTIRGAFPVFIYEQTDARIAGTDVLISAAPMDALKIVLQYALVRGRDVRNDLPLIYMPSDDITLRLTWSAKEGKQWKRNSLSLDGRYVFEQQKLRDDQDFTPPPDGYFLLGFTARTERVFEKGRLGLNLRIENMLNSRYRDYLNRQRYFSDEPGISVRIGARFSW